MRTIKNIQKYINKWVLLNQAGDEVIKASDSFEDILQELKSGEDKRSIFKVPSENTVFSP